MPELLHASTSRRLMAAMMGMLLLLLASVGMSLQQGRQTADTMRALAQEDLERMSLLSEINDNANEAARKLVILLAAQRDRRVEAYAEIDNANRYLDSAMVLLPRVIADGAANPQFMQVVKSLAHYRQSYQATAELIEGGDLKAAQAHLISDTDTTLSFLTSAVQALDRAGQQQLTERIARLRADLDDDRRKLYLLCGAGVLLALGLAWWIDRNVADPLRQAASVARRISAGDYSRTLVSRRRDEVGDIATALNGLAEQVQQREAALKAMIDVDSLTGVMQRNRFIAEHEALVAETLEGRGALVVLCFDIERLKSINALLGFDAGDAAIIDVARCAGYWIGRSDRVARLGGGTMVVLAELAPGHTPLACARTFQQAMEHRMVWADVTLDLSATVGVAACPDHGRNLSDLMRHAEQALIEAKRRRETVAVYSPSTAAARLPHLSLLSDLHRAVEEQQLLPFLQPKRCLSTGDVVGAEALVRWRHPDRGWISPGDFIPFAESTGRITAITNYMLTRCLELMGSTLPDIHVAVNISTYDLRDPGFPAMLERLLQRHGVPPKRLQIEVTESGLLDAGDDPVRLLSAVRALGVMVAIDDFGTGQSSLAYLQRLPANELKIDRSFVHGADTDARRRDLLGLIVRLGHGLGMTVTAEGVETEAELQLLRDNGCDLVQGYLIAKPMAIDAYLDWQARDSGAAPKVLASSEAMSA